MDIYSATEEAYKKGYADGKPKWIPVSEGLPEKRKFVLVFSTSKIVGEALFDSDGLFYWAGSSEYDMNIDVTHWMPLPEPPNCGAKMDGDGNG